MHTTNAILLLAGLPAAAFANLAGPRQATSASAATWSDECQAAEASFLLELETIEQSSVAPALQAYLATVVSSGITNYCEPTGAPAVVSAEWQSEVVSVDAIVNVYSADISQVQSCLASYQTAAGGTPYELAAAASALFSTISSLQACTPYATSAAASLPAETGAPPGSSNATVTALPGSGGNATTMTTAAARGSATASGAAAALTAGAGRVGGSGAVGLGGLVLGVMGLGVVVL